MGGEDEVPRSIEDAWNVVITSGIPEEMMDMCRACFYAGASSALSIAYHRGFVEMRADLARINAEMA